MFVFFCREQSVKKIGEVGQGITRESRQISSLHCDTPITKCSLHPLRDVKSNGATNAKMKQPVLRTVSFVFMVYALIRQRIGKGKKNIFESLSFIVKYIFIDNITFTLGAQYDLIFRFNYESLQ